MLQRAQVETEVAFFQASSHGLELPEGSWLRKRGLSRKHWRAFVQGEWGRFVPSEFHPVVEKLLRLEPSECYTVAEFPVRWEGTTIWLRVIAAAVESPPGERSVVGLAEDISALRMTLEWERCRGESRADALSESEDPLSRLRHDLSGPLTSILMSCEGLLAAAGSPEVRQKAEMIFSEALRIDRLLRSCRRG